MEDGSISQMGTPNEIFQKPTSRFVANFVGIRNFIKGELLPPGPDTGKMSVFKSNGLSFLVLTTFSPGKGHFTIRSDDITLSQSPVQTSAQNRYEGIIVDMAPSKLGVEIMVDIGFKLVAIITEKTVNTMKLAIGRPIWVNFKATAGVFLPE